MSFTFETENNVIINVPEIKIIQECECPGESTIWVCSQYHLNKKDEMKLQTKNRILDFLETEDDEKLWDKHFSDGTLPEKLKNKIIQHEIDANSCLCDLAIEMWKDDATHIVNLSKEKVYDYMWCENKCMYMDMNMNDFGFILYQWGPYVMLYSGFYNIK